MESRSLAASLNHDDLDEDRRRRQQQASTVESEPERPPLPQKPATGFERFLEEGLGRAGGRKVSGGDGKAGAFYTNGWAKGLTKGQAIEKARSMYENLDDEGRKKYEGEANLNDVRSEREIDAETNYQDQRNRALGLPSAGPAQPRPQLVPVNGPNGSTVYRSITPEAIAQPTGTPAPQVAPIAQPGTGTGNAPSPAQPNTGGTINGAPIPARTPSGTINGQPIAPRTQPGIYSDGQKMTRDQDGGFVQEYGPNVPKPRTSVTQDSIPPKQNNYAAVAPPGQNMAKAFNLDADGLGGTKPKSTSEKISDHFGVVVGESIKQQATAEIEAKYAQEAAQNAPEPAPAPEVSPVATQPIAKPAFGNEAPAGYQPASSGSKPSGNNVFSRSLSEVGADPNAIGDGVMAMHDVKDGAIQGVNDAAKSIATKATNLTNSAKKKVSEVKSNAKAVGSIVKQKGRSMKKSLEEDIAAL